MGSDAANVKLSFREKLGYSFGDAASNLYWKVFEALLFFFYTDIFQISATAAGTLFLVTRIWDAVNDPIMGAIADRTRTRFGRYRPFLLWCSIPLAGAGVLAFTTPQLEGTSKVVYAYVTYTLMMMMYTAINIPYSALMGVMSANSQERTKLSSFRFIAAFSVGMVVQSYSLDLAKWLGDGELAAGFPRLMMIYGLLAIGLFYVTFATTKERVEPAVKSRSSLWEDLGVLFRNRPWAVLAVLGFVVFLNLIIRGSTIVPYFKYYVGDVEFLGSTYSFTTVVGYFFGLGTLASVCTIPLTEPLSRRFGKARTYAVLMLLSAALMIPFAWLSPDDVVWMFILQLATGLVLGPTAPLVWAMYADTADYAEWKTSRRATGLVFSAATFTQKLGGGLAGSIAAYCLAFYGYDGAQATQSDETIGGMLLLMSWVPAAFAVLSASVALGYNLNNQFLATIRSDLAERAKPPVPGSAKSEKDSLSEPAPAS